MAQHNEVAMRPVDCVPAACRGELKLEFISSVVLSMICDRGTRAVGGWPASPSYLLVLRPRLSGLSHPTCPVAIRSQDTQRPGAVFGLRQTRNIENFLNDMRKRELGVMKPGETQQLHEFLDPSPLAKPVNRQGDKILFSLLLLGFKSSRLDPPHLSG